MQALLVKVESIWLKLESEPFVLVNEKDISKLIWVLFNAENTKVSAYPNEIYITYRQLSC